MNFNIFPAIDLRDGRVVRLQYGDPERETRFDEDPRMAAQRWIAAGASWLHVVNLDGAFGTSANKNQQIVPDLTQLGAKIQLGGGIRNLQDVARAIHRGVDRVILGTVAVEAPDIVEDAVRRFGPDKVIVGIDARDGKVRTRGWKEETAVSPTDLGWEMAALGVRTIIYTDISRDGVLTGSNVQASAQLAQDTGLNVIVSGGVASLDDIRQAHAFTDWGISGIIIGRALYDGKIDLKEAYQLIRD